MSTTEIIASAEQALESQRPEAALESLKSLCQNSCETNYVRGLIYRVQAVANGIKADEKAERYQRASNAFLVSSETAPQAVRSLILARHYENSGFVNLVRAGVTEEVSARLPLYQRAVQLLEEAINSFPQDYARNRSFLMGWKYLTEGKINALLSDNSDNLQEKFNYQQVASRHYAQSSQEFAKNGQSTLSIISSAWELYALGWSLVFQGETVRASENFRIAKSSFESINRKDLADACQIHIDQLCEVNGLD